MRAWQQILLIIGGLYVFSLVTLTLTQNPNLFPTVVLLGSFAVPIAFVTFFWRSYQLTFKVLFAFLAVSVLHWLWNSASL